LGDTQPTIAEVIWSAGHQTWMILSELGSLPPSRGIYCQALLPMFLAPSPVISAYLTLQLVVSLGGRPNKPCVDRSLILGFAHVRACGTD